MITSLSRTNFVDIECSGRKFELRPIFSRSTEFLRFPACLGQLAVRFLGKAEVVGALDGNFLCDFEDLANDVEIVFLRFFVDQMR